MEIGVPSLRHETYNQEENFALQRYELDLLEEKRNLAALRVASYKQRRFKEDDLVLRKINANTKEVSAGVLRPNWEGSYIIEGVVHPGTYKLKQCDGSLVPRTWNAEHFRPTINNAISM